MPDSQDLGIGEVRYGQDGQPYIIGCVIRGVTYIVQNWHTDTVIPAGSIVTFAIATAADQPTTMVSSWNHGLFLQGLDPGGGNFYARKLKPNTIAVRLADNTMITGAIGVALGDISPLGFGEVAGVGSIVNVNCKTGTAPTGMGSYVVLSDVPGLGANAGSTPVAQQTLGICCVRSQNAQWDTTSTLNCGVLIQPQ